MIALLNPVFLFGAAGYVVARKLIGLTMLAATIYYAAVV